jgi:hypothetical protein
VIGQAIAPFSPSLIKKMNTLSPFGKFVVSQDGLKTHYYLSLVTPRGYSIVLCERNEKKLQEIAAHLNAVVSGEVKPPKPSRRR